MHKSLTGTILAAPFLVFAAGSAGAATLTISGVSGGWTAAAPSSAADLNGIGTDEIKWGVGHESGGFRQSGYSFDSAMTGPRQVSEGTRFDLGAFRHNNWAIKAQPRPTAIASATLRLSIKLIVEGAAVTLNPVYSFTHWETPNKGTNGVCANGGTPSSAVNRNGCADRVQAVLNNPDSQIVDVGNTRYKIDITAFRGFGLEGGVPTFWTVENEINLATLSGIFTTEAIGEPPVTPQPPVTPEPPVTPAPVPLPASALFLLAGLLGLGAARRRR